MVCWNKPNWREHSQCLLLSYWESRTLHLHWGIFIPMCCITFIIFFFTPCRSLCIRISCTIFFTLKIRMGVNVHFWVIGMFLFLILHPSQGVGWVVMLAWGCLGVRCSNWFFMLKFMTISVYLLLPVAYPAHVQTISMHSRSCLYTNSCSLRTSSFSLSLSLR